MNVKNLLTALTAIALTACAASGGSEAPPQPPTAQASGSGATTAAAASDASFTDAQADAGRDIFRAVCTECHYSSEFSDSQFKFKWSRRSAGNLFAIIQNEMPETDPGSLSPEEAVSIVTYILRMNGFGSGASTLAPDRAVLDGISLASIRRP